MIYQDFCDMFWKAARMMKLNCNQIALYWCLLEHWKDNGYTSDLVIPNQDVMDELSITERALRDARKALIEKNLISFESGHAKRHPTYKILVLSGSKPKAAQRKKVETPPPKERRNEKKVDGELSLFGKPKAAQRKKVETPPPKERRNEKKVDGELSLFGKPKAAQRKKVETPPPSIEEVVTICMSKGMSRKEAEDFFYYYDAQGWVTSSGQKIKRVDSMVNRWLNNSKSKQNGITGNKQDYIRQQRNDEVERYILGGLEEQEGSH